MQPRPQPHHPGNERMFMFLAIIILLAVLLWIYRPPIIYGCCALLYTLWSWCDFPRIHPFVAQRINLLAWAGNHANTLDWSQFIVVMNRTAGILLAPLAIVVVWGGIAVRNHPMNHTRRPISIHTLPHIMARFSPSIIPALCYGDPKTQLLNCDPPEHRSAQAPEEFAVEHQLIVGQRLDRERAREVFARQLGTPLTGMDSFSPAEKALFAVFGLQVFLDDRKAAEALLDSLNRSCLLRSRRDGGQRGYPVLSVASRAFARVSKTPQARQWIVRYSTTRTALSALHAQQLRLPGARFRWLKGLDRTLWYALTSSDRSKVFVEGAGVIAVAQWETLEAAIATRLNTRVTPTPDQVDSAVDGLEAELRGLGMVLDDRPPPDGTPFTEEDEEEDDGVVILHSPDRPATTPPEKPAASQTEPSPARAFSRPRAQRPK
ncbi:secretion/conjugation apparatus DotM-related subunit [Enterobacter asburiae]|uniref:secretion/conjugation apparatus DotM-related subunit n=1 Tax=Enterobacter asburiae TaxID=61645 RepID=UPI003F56F1B3